MHLVSRHAPGFPAAAAVAAIGQVSGHREAGGRLSGFRKASGVLFGPLASLWKMRSTRARGVKQTEALKQLYRAGMGWPQGKRARHQLLGPWLDHEINGCLRSLQRALIWPRIQEVVLFSFCVWSGWEARELFQGPGHQDEEELQS